MLHSVGDGIFFHCNLTHNLWLLKKFKIKLGEALECANREQASTGQEKAFMVMCCDSRVLWYK